MKEPDAYAIKDKDDYIIFVDLCSEDEESCKYTFMAEENMSKYIYKKHGYRCVPVEITEIKPNEK